VIETYPLLDDIILRSRFKLTPAETRIALGIARGEPLSKIAERHGISVQTARKHLKSVFAKTETNRQVALALLLLEPLSLS
jgi:DNA-binding CsgD family transcriptional regulator